MADISEDSCGLGNFKKVKIIYSIIPLLLFVAGFSQELEPEITMERKKLIILTGEEKEKNK